MTSSPPRVARRLMSTEDGGSPMLSIPLERLETPPRPSLAQMGQGHAELGRRPPPSGLLRSRRLAHDRVPLRANLGTHYLFAHVGNPPQRVSLIVDTGSYTLAFPCAGCKSCRVGQRQAFWDPQLSETGFEVGCDDCQPPYKCSANKPNCTFRQSYSEGSSWSAYQMRDIVRLGGKEILLEEENETEGGPSAGGTNHVNFGCIQQQSGMFDTQTADGIIGLGPHKDSIVWQMAEMGSLDNKQFSLCLSQNGGNIVLGGFDPMLLEPGEYHEYTPANLKKGWFSVKVEDVSLGDTRIASPEVLMAFETGAGTIVDSGTTDTYLPRMMVPDWQKAWLAAVNVPFQNCANDAFCMKFTPKEMKALPVFSVTLSGGVTLSLPAEGYMEAGPRVDGGRVSYAPRIYLTEQTGAVLGANLMMDRNVLFDVSNERLGFVKARCDFDDSLKRDRARERKDTRNVTVVAPPKPNDFQIFVPVDVPSNVPQNVLENDPEGVMNRENTVGGISKGDEKDASGGAAVVGDKGSSGDGGIQEGGRLQEGASGDLRGWREGESGDEREGTKKEQVVDCEFELLKESPCDVECPQGLELPRTVKGSQKFLVHVTVPAKGTGKPCPGDEVREDGGMPLKIETCDVVCQPDAVLGLEEGGGGVSVDKHSGEEKLEGGSQVEGTGDEVDKEGVGRVGGTVETARKNMGNPDGHSLERKCSAPMAWLWSRCSKGCTQEMFEEDDCNGVREVRYCDTGDLCPTGSEGIYADLTFKVHIPELVVTGAGAAVAQAGEERWRLHVGKALVEALAIRVADSCRVRPGNIEATLLPSGCEDCDGITTVLLSVHMADPPAEMVPESLRFELGDPCITALGGESLASDLTPGVVRALIGMAGRLPGAMELADLTDVVEVERLSLRSATTAVPIIDNAASGVVGARSRTSHSGEHNHPAEVGRHVIPAPSSPSSTVIFVVQVAVIIAIIGVLLLMKWWRAVGERMVAADIRRRREGRDGSVSGDGKEDDEEAVKHSRGHQRRNSAARLNGEKDRTR